MDDTIEQLSKAWIKCLNERYGKCVNRDEVTDWDLHKFYPDLTKEQVFAPLEEDEFWKTVEPIPGAQEAIKQLIEDGHDLYIVTASSYKTIRSKLENVLFKYFPEFDMSHVIVCWNKEMIRGDIMIDDGLHNLVSQECYTILMSAPYNMKYKAEDYVNARVNNWEEAYREIQKVSGVVESNRRYVGVRREEKKMRNDVFTSAE